MPPFSIHYLRLSFFYDYKRKFNEDFYLKKKEVIDDFVKHNVLIMDKDRIRVAADYIYVLDSIVVKLI